MDETQPLLHDAASIESRSSRTGDVKNIVDFDPAGDAENPRDWPTTYKWFVVLLLAIEAFTVTFTCIAVVPVAGRIVSDLSGGQGSKSASVLLVTIWELGEAAGPLVIAPLSEVVGRYPVVNIANLCFIAATVLAALCQSAPLFIAARMLTGVSVVSNVLNPAIVGDIFVSEQRGSAMSLIMLAPLMGGATGPAIAGAIAEGMGWRAVLWMSVILMGTCQLLIVFCFRETFKVTILRRRAARLRAETGNPAIRTEFDAEGEKGESKLLDSVLRPAVVLAGSGVLQAISLYGSVVFTYFYVMSTTLPDILEDIYGQSPAMAGSAFIWFSVGSFVSVVGCNFALDRIYIRLKARSNGIGHPEYRLPLVLVGGFTMPVVVAIYGWVAQWVLPVPLLLFVLAMLGFTMMLAFLPLLAYVVDAFKLYAASAMTAVIVTRCLMSTFLPLALEPMVKKFGYGWAFTALALITIGLVPIPMFVLKYGRKWRQRSKYTRDEQGNGHDT